VDEFPLLYSFDKEQGRLAILFFGMPKVETCSQSCSTRREGEVVAFRVVCRLTGTLTNLRFPGA